MTDNGNGRHPAPDPAAMRQAVDELHDAVGVVPSWSTPPSHAPADAALVTYAAACRQCIPDPGAAEAVGAAGLAVPFASQADRDRWALGHARTMAHKVTLIEQHPSTGSTVTGTAFPDDPADPDVPPARHSPPLVAFVVREGAPPDMLVRIPPRAAAAWLLTAAHASLLGRGSLGINQPHRVLYVGRITRAGDEWQVRVDGLLGATERRFGIAVGLVCRVDGKLTPPQAEDVVERLVAETTGLGRNLFSVVLMADAVPRDPADEQADATLRGERLAELRRRGDPDPPAG